MTNVGFVISNIHKSLAFEWIAENIDAKKYTLHFFLLNNADSYLEHWLRQRNYYVCRINYSSKYSLPWAIIMMFFLLAKNRIAVVHCHLFDASLVGLIAAKLAGVQKRIYTRHHAMMNHQYYPNNVKVDLLINSMATLIIAPSQVVRESLIRVEKVSPQKVTTFHHGFDLKLFAYPDKESVDNLRSKYNPENKYPVIGIISRYIHLKGIQNIIPAFKNLLTRYPNALLILANANGDYSQTIKKMLSDLPKKNYAEIPFENENTALYKLFDMHIHVPISKDIEAFGQTYVEALAAGIPSIFTLAGVAPEFIVNEHNALLVDYNHSQQIFDAMLKLLNDNDLRAKIIKQGISDVNKLFSLDKMIIGLEKIYQ